MVIIYLLHRFLFNKGKKTLAELRQVYFKLKEDIFSKTGFGIGYNTEALELILKENFDSNIRMSDIKEPK